MAGTVAKIALSDFRRTWIAASRSLRLGKPHRPLAKKVFVVPVVEIRNSSLSVGAASRLA
ncbi:MAG: hypothetical protein ABW310_11540 [Acidimicrobiales bacterium]